MTFLGLVFGYVILTSCISIVANSDPQKQVEIDLPFIGESNIGKMFKKMLSQEDNPAIKSIVQLITPEAFMTTTSTTTTPKPTTTTTTTTTLPPSTEQLSPLQDLTETLVNIPASLPSSKLLEAPVKAIDKVIKNSLGIGQAGIGTIDQAADSLVKASENADMVVSLMSGNGFRPRRRGDNQADNDPEQLEFRRPKYLSKECNFRIACEVGKLLLKPLAQPLTSKVAELKVVQDLQNRYTRAMTYGILHKECERYYCLFVQFLGGPNQFAKGVADLLNRVANPDLYED